MIPRLSPAPVWWASLRATLDGASWQRWRTHDTFCLMDMTSRRAGGWFNAMLHSVYDQPDAKAVHAAQFV